MSGQPVSELFAWILQMEERLEIGTMWGYDGEALAEGRCQKVTYVLSREQRARFFGRADAIFARQIRHFDFARMIGDGTSEEAAERVRAALEVEDGGMVVTEDSPEEDLREWARRLERRLGIDRLPPDRKAQALGTTDVIALMDATPAGAG